jgi:5-methylcytosine-specific restriction enzyme A
MPLLYYWRGDNYARDQEFGFGYHLSQNSPAMASARPGESLWAFTRRRRDGLYILAAELVVHAITRNRPAYRYGTYRAWGDLDRSRYFDVEAGPDAEPLIRRLTISARGQHLGQSFQGHAAVRLLDHADHRVLVAVAADLPLLARVGIYPEDELEARLVHGAASGPLMLPNETRRSRYLYRTVDVQRSRRHVAHLQGLYGGRCQVCLYDPRARYGHPLCEGHHLVWLSRGGEDEVENMALLCPNHHAAVHRADAPFDYADLAFTFGNRLVEPVQLNDHLPRAA